MSELVNMETSSGAEFGGKKSLPVEVRKEIALSRAGATREVAYKAIVEGLNSETMVLDKFGNEHYTPDTTSRLRAAEMISKLNGDLKNDGATTQVSINIGATPDEIKALIDMADDVKRQVASLRTSGRQTGDIIDATIA